MIHYLGLSVAASQTDNTVGIVGGVASGVLIFTVIVAVMIMALLKFCCGLPARTPVQYVYIVQIHGH